MLDCIKRSVTKNVEEGDSPSLLVLGETTSGALSLSQVVKKGQRRITIGQEQFCYENRLKVLKLFSLGKTPRRIYCGLPVIKRDLVERWGEIFVAGAVVTGLGVMVLN